MSDLNNAGEGPRKFHSNFVLRVTFKRMLFNIDTSIKKTFDRIQEFENHPELSNEVFKALSKLNYLQTQIQNLQKAMGITNEP
jgi:hypothetical protein